MPDAVINQILVATDFEPPARAALDWAVGLARPIHAGVLIAHVYDLPLLGLPDAAMVDGVIVPVRPATPPSGPAGV